MTKINYPKLDLYHYTSLNTLMAIIENKTIRLTDYQFLNDTSELSFAIDELRKILENYKDETNYYALLEALNNISNGKMQCNQLSKLETDEILITPKIQNTQFYIISLQSDALNMWKMYAEEFTKMEAFSISRLFPSDRYNRFQYTLLLKKVF